MTNDTKILGAKGTVIIDDPQAETTPHIPAGYMADNKGRLVPTDLVKPQHKLEDQTVAKILGYADELAAQIGRFKAKTFDDLSTLMDLLAENYGVERGAGKGNATFTSYDGLSQVKVAVQDLMDFGPELQIAKQLIDECLADWSSEGRKEMQAIVNLTFNVDKPGKVNREGLFKLRSLEIDDERWKKAVEAINDSIRFTGSKTYVRIYRRENLNQRFKQVPIDLAAA